MTGPRALIFGRRKPGLTVAQMREYQETKHLPLIRKTLGDLFPKHTRRYTPRAESGEEEGPAGAAAGDKHPNDSGATPAAVAMGPAAGVWWDVMVELEFRDAAHLQAVQAVMADPEKMAPIGADEDNFVDRSSLVFYLVDEYHNTPAGSGEA